MPLGVRQPRAKLEKKLVAIIESIDAQPVREIRWPTPFLNMRCQGRFEVVRVYVAGTFARGALLCGDLDLLVEVSGERVDDHAVAVELRGRRTQVQIHIGTPQENSSRVAFPDAVLLWSKDDREFVARLAAIPIDPKAGRFARKHDALPFSLDRLYLGLHEAEGLVDLIADESLVSEWFALEDVPNVASGAAVEFPLAGKLRRAGRKTGAMLGTMARWLVGLGADLGRRDYHAPATDFSVDGYRCLIGRPSVPTEALDTLGCRALAIVPHPRRGGPNGIWMLRRGPRHGLVRQFEGTGLWLIRTSDGGRYVLEAEGLAGHGVRDRPK